MSPLRVVTVPALAAVPGLVHGFEQRLGPPGSESRAESRERVSRALESSGRLLLLKQVHGCRVEPAPWTGTPEADAGLSTRPGELVGVETADCLPVLIVDPERRAAAAVHAGWRGTSQQIAAAAVRTLAESGSRVSDLVAALGPGIGPCCYEVGDELRAAFGADADAVFVPGPRGRPHLDVRLANVRQLLRAGLAAERIHHVPDCTSCSAGLYHSFRRDGAGAGRMINFVGFRAGAAG